MSFSCLGLRRFLFAVSFCFFFYLLCRFIGRVKQQHPFFCYLHILYESEYFDKDEHFFFLFYFPIGLEICVVTLLSGDLREGMLYVAISSNVLMCGKRFA